MVETNVVLTLLQTISIMVGIGYYILNIQNNQRNQELTLKAQELAAETRQASLLMEIYSEYRSLDFKIKQIEIINQEWTDFNDFWEKYGSQTNPEAWSSWQSYAAFFHGIGVLLKKGLIDIELVEELLVNVVTISWYKMSPILKSWRENIVGVRFGKSARSSNIVSLAGFDYLWDELRKRDPENFNL